MGAIEPPEMLPDIPDFILMLNAVASPRRIPREDEHITQYFQTKSFCWENQRKRKLLLIK